MADTVLLIDAALLDQPAPAARQWLERLQRSGVPVVALNDVPRAPSPLLRAVAAVSGQAPRSWLITRHAETADAVASAGFAGVVVVGAPSTVDRSDELGITVATAADLADAARAMIPRSGGCWHDHRA